MKMIELKPNEERVMVPAGKYILGDPCYCIPYDSNPEDSDKSYWDTLGESCCWWGNSTIATLTLQDKTWHVLGFGTAFGDGSYEDNQGYTYDVDAGLIGLVPYDLVKLIDPDYELMDCQRIVIFDRDTLCTNNGGVMTFGDIRVDTTENAYKGDWD